MLLAAADFGLGSCYLESPTLAFNIPAVCESAKIADNAQPQAVIVFGYTNDTAPHKDYPQNPDNIVYVKLGYYVKFNEKPPMRFMHFMGGLFYC